MNQGTVLNYRLLDGLATVDSRNLEDGPGTSYVGVHSSLGFRVNWGTVINQPSGFYCILHTSKRQALAANSP